MIIKLRSSGRGRQYTTLRGVVETAQSLAYAYDWPARLLNRRRRGVRVLRHELNLLPPQSLAPGASARRPLRVAFVSDLHLGPLTPMPLLEAAFDRVVEARPDVLALGGDYVSLDVTPSIADRLRALVARVPAAFKVAVLGNHDLWTRHELLEEALGAAGAQVLMNQAVRLPAPYDDVTLVGLDDPWTGEVDPDKAFAGVAPDSPLTLVLAHAPEAMPLVAGRGARLLMCGHTHGGQVAAPWGPVLVQGRLSRQWPSGLHELDGMHLFVSRGVGFSDLPIRAFAPSDIAIFDLR